MASSTMLTPLENTCDPDDELRRDQLVALVQGGTPHETSQELEDVDPLCDPVRLLRDGHGYRIRLLPQKVRWQYGTADEVFVGEKYLPAGLMEKEVPLVFASSDELYVTVVGYSKT